MIETIRMTGDALEEKLKSWSKGPGTTEEQMCLNAEKVIKNALSSDPELSKMNTSVFTKGSFKNRTNIAKQSDVDVCIRLNSVFYGVFPEGKIDKDLGYEPGEINYSKFKSLVVNAIKNYITTGTVEIGDKSIKIRENSYRVNADIVPAFTHKFWYPKADSYGRFNIRAEGIGIYSEKEKRKIYNWPAQDYDNGVSKNANTSKMYKKSVRILKNLQCDMKDNNYITDTVPSFLIESMVWNVPSEYFYNGEYKRTIRAVLAYIFNNLLESSFDYEKWVEVNDIKFLFHESQPWTKSQALRFISRAWDYLGFE